MYDWKELVWIFFLYSFLGWTLETVFAAVKQRKFVNRGFLNAPVCIIYGISALIITVYLKELNGFWLFLGAMIWATVIEWIAGHLIEIIYHERWWNYSGIFGNLDGYICFPASVIWGFLAYVMMVWGNGFFVRVFRFLPDVVEIILAFVILGILLFDLITTLIIMSGRSRKMEKWESADALISGVSARFGRWICKRVDARINRAYPKVEKTVAPKKNLEIFAYGCSFYKIVLLFFIGAFLGDVVETIFCRITMGVWMSRSSVVWGPFSIVWGLAISLATLLLYRYRNRSERFLFLTGTFLGGAYEYFCSVFTEMVFGTVFWDYSHITFNLGGRINLLYCFFWGIAAVVWFKACYPFISRLIEKIPKVFGKIMTWILIVFMLCNVAVTSVALIRFDERARGIEAQKEWQIMMDEHFDDAIMRKIYPKAKTVQ